MPTETTWIYPKPKSWDEFEAIVWDLFRRSWGDPEAQRYGRSGQEQHGIDVFGRSQELGGAYVGVQCKRYEDEQLTEKVIRNEIRKLEDGIKNSALPFIPVEFIIATTASRDVVLQNKIIQINQEQVTSGGFSVALRFWEDLSDMLASPGYEDLSRKHYPTLASQDRTKIDELNILKQAVMEKRRKLKEKVAEPFAITGNPYPFGKALDLNAGQGLVGRDGIIQDLVKRIRGQKTVFLTGEGGVGKTSLLRAGLMLAFLKEDHLPILLEASEEPLEVSIKRQFVRDIENTVYLKTQSLGSFLQAVADCLPKGSLVILFVDNFEAFFDHDEAQKEHFRQEWASSIASQANIRWLFSLQQFVSHLGFFKSEDVDPISDRITLPPLDRKSAQEVVQSLALQAEIKIDQTVLDLVLDELGVTSINPSRLVTVCYFLSGGNGPLVKEWTHEEYNRQGEVSGIEQGALERIIQTFPEDESQPAWQALACLSDEPHKRMTKTEIGKKLKLNRLLPDNLPELLERLEDNHLVDAEDGGYRLASANLKPRLQQWSQEQTAGNKARKEAARQVEQSRKTALRGLVGGAVGFALFELLFYTGPELGISYTLVFSLTAAAIGAISGILFTLNIDMTMAAYESRPGWVRYLFGGLGGALGLTLGILLYALTYYPDDYFLRVFPGVVVEGGIWGLAVGTGAAWVMSAREHAWLKGLAVSAACGLVLVILEFIGGKLFFAGWGEPNWLRIFLAGAITPFCILSAILFGRPSLEERGGP